MAGRAGWKSGSCPPLFKLVIWLNARGQSILIRSIVFNLM